MNRPTKFLLISALVIATPMLAYLCYLYFKPPADVESMTADLKETAQKIGADYIQDEMKSDAKYLGKIIDIRGRVAEVQNLGSEGKTVYFKTSSNGAPVAVLMAPGISEDRYPSTGDSVLIRAICNGFLMDVTFNRGVVIETY